MSLLELNDIYAGYLEGSDVLQGISLEVEQGSVVSLLGRNGVGKTTTLRTIVGILTPTQGSIIYNGEDITGFPPHEVYKRDIGIVVEERDVFPDLTVEENLKAPIVADTGRSIEELYDLFPRLEERRATAGSYLSGGEQQMLALARALRGDPDLLLLDEPTEGLAPQIVQTVVDAIEDIVVDNKTVLFVEQNAEVALDLASHTYIVDRGEIVFDGPPEDVRANQAELKAYLGVERSK